MRAPWIALAVALACAACNSTSLKPGFCRGPADCPGSTCNTTTWRCMTDGGMDMTDARDAPVEMPFNCNNGKDMCSSDAGTNVCNPDGGMCVECLTDDHCLAKNTKAPICRSQLCGPCQTDADCPDPKICLADGHCAKDTEVIYVEFKSAGCTAADGSPANPYCTPNDAVPHLASDRQVIVIRGPNPSQLLLATTGIAPVVVGKMGTGAARIAAPAPTTGIQVSSDTVLIRDIAIAGGTDATSRGIGISGSQTNVTLSNVTVNLGTDGLGIQADNGAMLTMDYCTVMGNKKGGIFLDGARFDIRNTIVTNNGPGDDMTSGWGGLRIKNVTSASKSLQHLTVRNNNQIGVSCTAAVMADGVLVSDSAGGIDISGCGFNSCVAGTTNCGAPF